MISRSTSKSATAAGIDSANERKGSSAQQRRRLRKRISFVLALLAGTALVAGAWVAIRAQEIHAHLLSTRALVADLRTELSAGNIVAAKATLLELQRHSTEAREAGTDPVWRAAGALPIVGGNFKAVSEITASADDMINLGLAPLIEDFDSLDWAGLAPVNGRVDLAAIEAIAPRLSGAANTIQLSYGRLAGIERTGLLPQIARPLQEATAALEKAKEAMSGAAVAAEVVPGMLGAEGPRNYLLLVQNNAEIRATGGIPGALAVVKAEDGELELQAQGSANEMGRFDPPVIVDESQTSIYSTRIGRFMQSVNLTPDFPTAAESAARMWEIRHEDSRIDGVIALDPVALAHILGAIGPVELSFEDPALNEFVALSGLPTTLTEENVVPTLLSDVYAAIEQPKSQDKYFAAVAAKVFDVLTSGTGDNTALIESLVKSTHEGRLYVWSANEDEQTKVASTSLAGTVTGPRSGGAAFGAYFNDGTGAKMDFYVRRSVQLHRSCNPGGYLQYTLTATLTNTAPRDAAESLPAYVTGGGNFGVPPGTVQTNLVAYGPDQSQLQTARVNGEPAPLGSHQHGDRPVGILTSRLDPGETVTIEVDFSNIVQPSEPSLDVTPTIQPVSEVILPLVGDATCP